MELKLYNTLTRTKEPFAPLDANNVRMYVCGPTVYDFAHIGNARPLIVFDVLFRLLRYRYGAEHVTYVRNITDVDDKINARAAERVAQRGEAGADLNAEIRRLTEETYANFKQDVAALGCLAPTHEPRATEYVSNPTAPTDMIRLIQRLIANGNAYAAEGHVLFDVPSMPDYGTLARRSLDEMVAGARVDVAPYKRNAMDFVLWKPSSANEPGWDSPWGRGRPGWHIECSAMAGALLGETFDIHGGGIDLVFPHHENELAQSRCAFHTGQMAQVWMHNGFLQVEGEKMAKSAGNFVTIRELLETEKFGGRRWSGEVLRLAMLRTHYRQPIDWTVRALEEADQTRRAWANILERHQTTFESDMTPPDSFIETLADDLNTPMAIAEMHTLAAHARRGDFSAAERLHQSGKFIGVFDRYLLSSDDESSAAQAAGRMLPDRDKIDNLVNARAAARESKNFRESDRIRDELAAMGILLKDSKDGTTWEVAR